MIIGIQNGEMNPYATKAFDFHFKNNRDLRPPRFAVQLTLFNQEFSLSTEEPALLKNLSSRGAFIETQPTVQGKIIDLEFSFPGQKINYQIKAQVTWSRDRNQSKNKPTGMGVRFLEFNQGTEQELINHLKYWGELRKPSPRIFPLPTGTHQTRPGCTGMPPNTMLMMYLTFEDNEIEEAIDFFLQKILF